MPHTMKVFQMESHPKPPKRLRLQGLKHEQIESAQHVIEFPGGAVEIARCDDGTYWAHIIVNRDQVVPDSDGIESALGEIVGSRIDYQYPAQPNVVEIPDAASVRQIAVRIRPRRVT